ncbi:MAG: response regulator [Opitutaceae bacterium]|nr:response regulator [Opitutaceae bacterium]
MPAPVLRFIAAVLALAPVLARGAAGEAGRPLLQAFTPRDYRAHQQIWMGAQAPDGTMWFGNSGSVLNYDGSTWRRITVPTSFVRAVVLGPDGRIYAGGTDELGYFAPGADGRGAFVSLADKLPADARPLGVVWSAAAAHGAVWFATETKVLRWRDGRFDAWTHANKPRQMLLPAGGELYLHRQGVGLFRFDGAQFASVTAAPEIAGGLFCNLEALADGGLLITTLSAGCFEIRDGRVSRRPTPLDALMSRGRFRNMVRLPDGTRVIDGGAAGLIIADREFNFLNRVTATTGLGAELILSLTPDREGGVWVGTGNGVVRVEPSPRFTAFDDVVGLPRGLIHDLKRHEGALHAATASGVFRLVPAEPQAGEVARMAKIEAGPGVCWSLVSHPSGLLVAQTLGVIQLAPGAAPRTVLNAPDGVSKLAVLPRHPGRVFVGRFTGFNVLRFDDGAWRDEGGVPNLNTEVRTIAEERDGTLWLGTPTRGFLKLNRPAGAPDDWPRATVTVYREDHGLPKGQGWSHVYNIGDDVLFVTDAGTFRHDAAADRFVLADAWQIAGRHERTQLWPLTPTDRPDRIWAQADTEKTEWPRLLGALAQRAGQSAEFAPLPRKILDRVAFGGARFLHWEREGAGEMLWLAGPDGLVRADLSQPPAPAAPPAVLIRGVTLPDGTQRATEAEGQAPHFPHGHAPLILAYAAPRYGAGPGLRYQTRLRGYDDAWSPWSDRTTATYTGLWGGPFTFEVRAMDAEGLVGAPATFTFRVTPPWHLRPLAFGLYALLALGAVAGFVRWRLSHAERERRRLEALVAERTRDLATARDAAESASRAKSAFLAAMSHELRTPLNGVIGYAQLLQGDARLAADQRERIRIVHQSGEHLLRMINDVLDLAKIEAGKIELRPAPFALRELLDDLCAAHQNAAAAKRLAFHRELPADLPAWVEGDAQKLRQVLDNLIGNAVKFTSSGSVTLRVSQSAGSVAQLSTLNAQPQGEGLSFAVHDTGPGIAAADQARLFQPFEQARTARPNAPGTGLGLAISRALVARMGGTLALASEPGRGSVFSFSVTLPVHAGAPRPETPAVAGYEGPRRRVLVVDDHAVNRSLLTDLLGPLGFVCDEADSGEAALARLTAAGGTWPDLAIVDLRMEGMDGLELTRRLRAQPRAAALRVLLTSASVISFDAAEARAAGCDDFLPKPFRTADLIEKLGALLALRWVPAAATGSRQPFGSGASTRAPLPEAARAVLRDALAQGDLEAFRAALARVRAEHPADAARWDELDEAAAGFQLPRLRQLLDLP